jgi:sugar phosphate isomerase/epimerase
MDRRNFIKGVSTAAMAASLIPSGSLFGKTGAMAKKTPHICIFSKHLQWLNYRDMARLAAGIGFTGIDLTVRKGGHVLPENVKRDLPVAVEQIREAGLEVPMITTGITEADDPFTRNILETAGKLGIGKYRPGWYRYKKGRKVSDSIKHAREQLAKLQVINQANNIAASYQNHSGRYVGGSGWDLLEIIQELDPRWVGVQFDIRHAIVEGPETWPMVLEILAPWINTIDIKDFTWDLASKARVVNVPLGQGLVPIDSFLQNLEDLEIREDFSIHYEYPLGGAEKGKTELTISKEVFTEQVSSDFRYLKTRLVN